jgi:hypothetical protein
MTPAAIAAEAKKAGLPSNIELPTVDVAGKPINSGDRARAFASYVRIHALEATGGKTYAEMPRFATADGKGTNDPAQAQKGPSGQPLDNPARQVWITETALSTALNTSYMAEQLSIFGIVVGVALLLTGIGLLVLTLGGALRHRAPALATARRPEPASGPPESRRHRVRGRPNGPPLGIEMSCAGQLRRPRGSAGVDRAGKPQSGQSRR